MGWEFPLLFLTAIVAMTALSVWQNGRYAREVNRLARAHAGPDRHLVSGRCKGRVRGAIAVLVVDVQRGEIVQARAMTGASVFAALRPAPTLLGPVSSVLDRVTGKALRKAVDDALTRLPAAKRTATAPQGRPRTGAPRIRPLSQKVKTP